MDFFSSRIYSNREAINHVAFFDNDAKSIVCSENYQGGHSVFAMDMVNQKVIRSFSNLEKSVHAFIEKESNRVIILGRTFGGRSVLEIWYLDRYVLITTIELTYGKEYHQILHSNADTNEIYVLSDCLEVCKTESEEMEVVIESGLDNTPLLGVMKPYSKDHIYLFGVVSEQIVHYDLTSREIIDEFEAPSASGKQLMLSNEGSVLIAVSSGLTGVYVYDLASKQRILPEMIGRSTMTALFTVMKDERVILQVSRVGVIAYEIDTKAFSIIASLNDGFINTVECNVNGDNCLVGQENGDVTLLTLQANDQGI